MEMAVKDFEATNSIEKACDNGQYKLVEQKNREVDKKNKNLHQKKRQQRNEFEMKIVKTSENKDLKSKVKGKRSSEIREKELTENQKPKKVKFTREVSEIGGSVKVSKTDKIKDDVILKLKDISNEMNASKPICIDNSSETGSCQIESDSDPELPVISQGVKSTIPNTVQFIMNWARKETHRSMPIVSPMSDVSDEHPEFDSLLNYEDHSICNDLTECSSDPKPSDSDINSQTANSNEDEVIDYSVKKVVLPIPKPLMSTVIPRPEFQSAARPAIHCPQFDLRNQQWLPPRGRGHGRGFTPTTHFGFPPRFNW